MPLRRMEIQSVVVGGGPVASLVVLSTQEGLPGEAALQLPIRIGSVEATSITMGVRERSGSRPMTQSLPPFAQNFSSSAAVLPSIVSA